MEDSHPLVATLLRRRPVSPRPPAPATGTTIAVKGAAALELTAGSAAAAAEWADRLRAAQAAAAAQGTCAHGRARSRPGIRRRKRLGDFVNPPPK